MPTINTASAVAVYAHWANDLLRNIELVRDSATADHLRDEARAHWGALANLTTPMRSLLSDIVCSVVTEEHHTMGSWLNDLASGYRPNTGMPYVLAEVELCVDGELVSVTVDIGDDGKLWAATCDPIEEFWYPNISEALRHRNSIPEYSLSVSQRLIREYYSREFPDSPMLGDEFNDLTRVPLVYTTTEDYAHEINTFADLVTYRVYTELDGVCVYCENFDSREQMNEECLPFIEFSTLVSMPEHWGCN